MASIIARVNGDTRDIVCSFRLIELHCKEECAYH